MGKPSGIFLNLRPEVIDQIDEICGGPSYTAGQKRTGRSGGRAAWVRDLIHRELGLEPPVDPHLERSKGLEARLKSRKNNRGTRVSALTWAKTVEKVLALRKEGRSLRAIARQMEDDDIPTRRGGKWSAQTVRNILLDQVSGE